MHREDQFIPELIVRGEFAALDFYKSVFGAGTAIYAPAIGVVDCVISQYR